MEYENPRQGITVTWPKGMSPKELVRALRRMADVYDEEDDETLLAIRADSSSDLGASNAVD